MVPEEWRFTTLKQVADFNPETLPASTNENYKFLYYDIASVQGPGRLGDPSHVSFRSAPGRARRIVRKNDILVSGVRPYLQSFAQVKSNNLNLVASTGFCVIRPKKVDAEFIFQHVLSNMFVRHLVPRMKGSNYPAVSKQDIAEYEFALPPMAEQKRIAEVLSSVDEAIAATQAVINEARTSKQAVLESLLTNGIGHSRFKETEIGWMPESWSLCKLGEIAKAKGGKRMPKGRPFADHPTPYPYIRVNNFVDGTISKYNLQYVLPEDRAKISNYTIGAGDVYISIAGTLGLVGTVPQELGGAQLTENAAKLVVKNPSFVDTEYLGVLLSSRLAQAQIQRLKGIGGGVPKLALFRVESMLVPIPSLEEQREIVKWDKYIGKTVQYSMEYLDRLRGVKSALMSDLFAGRRRVPRRGGEAAE